MKNVIAVLFAAGKGSRLLPLTDTIPKPLIKVHGTPIIETQICALLHCGVDKIYIVVGYKKEQFYYLSEKYSNVVLIENPEYTVKNNISSFYAMGERIGKTDCFLCEADLYVKNQDLFRKDLETSCYLGKYIAGETKEWVAKVKNSRITHLCIGGKDDYGLVGISFWKKKDALFLREAVKKAYDEVGHEQLFWDDIADRYFDHLFVKILPICGDEIVEIDTLDELIAVDGSYSK